MWAFMRGHGVVSFQVDDDKSKEKQRKNEKEKKVEVRGVVVGGRETVIVFHILDAASKCPSVAPVWHFISR